MNSHLQEQCNILDKHNIHHQLRFLGSFPKERLEIFAAGRVLQLDNFRRDTPR
jgi:hypothetical protein